MPYIKQEKRHEFELTGANGHHPNTETAGELNYEFTQKILNHLKINGRSYSVFNDVIGALEGAKIEFYRRVVVSYEDKKIQENGDLY